MSNPTATATEVVIPTVTVDRVDYKRRSHVRMECSRCGKAQYRVPLSEADIYEEGCREHVCGTALDAVIAQRLAFRRLIRHMLEGVLRD